MEDFQKHILNVGIFSNTVIFQVIVKVFFKAIYLKRTIIPIKLCFSVSLKGELLNFLRNCLHERNQRVVLNGQISPWELIKSEVPQVPVLGPLF